MGPLAAELDCWMVVDGLHVANFHSVSECHVGPSSHNRFYIRKLPILVPTGRVSSCNSYFRFPVLLQTSPSFLARSAEDLPFN